MIRFKTVALAIPNTPPDSPGPIRKRSDSSSSNSSGSAEFDVVFENGNYVYDAHIGGKHLRGNVDIEGTLKMPFQQKRNIHYEMVKKTVENMAIEAFFGGLDGPIYKKYMDPFYVDPSGKLNDKQLSKAASKLKKFLAADFVNLAAMTYTEESPEDLITAALHIIFLFVHDDFRDSKDSPIGKDPEKIKIMNKYLHFVLEQGLKPPFPKELDAYKSIIDALANTAKNIRSRLVQKKYDINNDPGTSKKVGIEDYASSMLEYMQANVREAENRRDAESQDPDSSQPFLSGISYFRQRKFTSAVYPCFELGFLLRGVHIPEETRKDVNFKDLKETACNHICAVNDILSFKKELEDEDFMNYVIIHAIGMKEDNPDLNYSLNEAIKLANEQLKEFIKVSKRFEKSPQWTEVLGLIKDWLSGNPVWHLLSKRYALDPVRKSEKPQLQATDPYSTDVKRYDDGLLRARELSNKLAQSTMSSPRNCGTERLGSKSPITIQVSPGYSSTANNGFK